MMPKGHAALSLEGHQYLPDEAGAFTVPEQHVAELVRVHGAQVAVSIQDLLAQADDLDSKARAAAKQAETLKQEADAVRKRAAAEDARLKAAKKAADDAAKAAEEAAKKAGAKKAGEQQ